MVWAELRYPQVEKLALALVESTRRLRPYFQAHKVIVLTNFPLRQVLQKPEASGRLMKWAVELGEYDIQFRPRSPIKRQAIADFIVEWTPPSTFSDDMKICVMEMPSQTKNRDDLSWELYVDGSSNRKGCGVGLSML